MIKIKFAQLPERARADIAEKEFLYGYAVPERGRYVVRLLDRASRTTREAEFDASAGRWLNDAERQRELPARSERIFAELGVVASITHRLDPVSHGLYAHIDVFGAAGHAPLASLDVEVYPPILESFEDQIAATLKTASFPTVYAGWSRDEKSGYWATLIHRLRRAHGESGRDENEIFTPELVLDFEKLDPDFRALLPQVLPLVARLEQTPPDEIIAAFRQRVDGRFERPEHV